MYQKILVPLDGSKLAECVLPYVEKLAQGCNTEQVILVSVTERIKAYAASAAPPLTVERSLPAIPVTRVPLAVGKMQKQAERYLDRIAKRLAKKGLEVQREVLLGNPAEEIASYAEHNGCDLIAMASHGRSGPGRWAFGSVADKVFRASGMPVLMVKAPGAVAAT